MAAKVAKLSVAIGIDDIAWARKHAKRLKTSVSAVVSSAVREARRQEAMREVLGWLGKGRKPLTRAELDAVDREWKG